LRGYLSLNKSVRFGSLDKNSKKFTSMRYLRLIKENKEMKERLDFK